MDAAGALPQQYLIVAIVCKVGLVELVKFLVRMERRVKRTQNSACVIHVTLDLAVICFALDEKMLHVRKMNAIAVLKVGVENCVRKKAALDYTTRTVQDMELVIVLLKLVNVRQVGVVVVANESCALELQNAVVTVSAMPQTTLQLALVTPDGWDFLAKANALMDRLILTQVVRSEEHTSELQSRQYLVCRLLLEKKNKKTKQNKTNT